MAANVVEILKALADDTRLRILHLIDQCGPDICVCDMVAVFGLPQSTISRHLMRMRHMGILTDSRDGMWINYSLRSDSPEPVQHLLPGLRECWRREESFIKDKQKFKHLHAANQIVRCKRGQAMASARAEG